MAVNREELLKAVKSRMDEIEPGLYESLEAGAFLKAKSNGVAQADITAFETSQTLAYCTQALLGYEVTADNDLFGPSGRKLFDPSPEQLSFVEHMLGSGHMRGTHIMESIMAKENADPGSMQRYDKFDQLHITKNDLIGMISAIAYKSESLPTDKEQDFILRMTENAHIRQSAQLGDNWMSDIDNTLSSGWGIDSSKSFFEEFSLRKESYDRDNRIVQATNALKSLKERITVESPEDSYRNATDNIHEIVKNVKTLMSDNSDRLGDIPDFTLCNGTKLFITPMYMGEESEPLIMAVYSTDNVNHEDIDFSNPSEGTIFYPLESLEMEALIKASGGFSTLEYDRQAAHDELVGSITNALALTNENDHTGLREKADEIGKRINAAVKKAAEHLDNDEIQGILDGIRIDTLGGHKLSLSLEGDSLRMDYAAPGKDYVPVDFENGEAFTLIPDTERVEYFINAADFERTVNDAKIRIAGMLGNDSKTDSMTMSVVRHTDKELAYYNFRKDKDADGRSVLKITDVTDPAFPKNIGTTDLSRPSENGDLDWVYYGATEAVIGTPYHEEEKVNKALEKGSITVADKNGLPKTYKIERDDDGKVIGIDGNSHKIHVEGLIAKEAAPDVAIVTKLKTSIINRKAIEVIRTQGFKGFVDSIEARGHSATDSLTIHSANGTKTDLSITYNGELKKFELIANYYNGKTDKDGNPTFLTAKQTLTKEQLLGSETLSQKMSNIVRGMTKTSDDIVVQKTVHLKDRLGKTYGLQAKIMAGDAKRLFTQIKANNKEILRLANETKKEEKNWEKFIAFAKKHNINYAMMEASHKAVMQHLAECTKEVMDKNDMEVRRAESRARG